MVGLLSQSDYKNMANTIKKEISGQLRHAGCLKVFQCVRSSSRHHDGRETTAWLITMQGSSLGEWRLLMGQAARLLCVMSNPRISSTNTAAWLPRHFAI